MKPRPIWFRALTGPADFPTRLLCFPYAGADALAYTELFAPLTGKLEVLALQLPGRWPRVGERLEDDLPTLVRSLCGSLLPYLDRPFAFFGHSMGTIVAYELARHLMDEFGTQPEHLFFSAYRAPHCAMRHKPLHSLDTEELILELERLRGTPTEVLRHRELMDLVIPRIRADAKLVETYKFLAGTVLRCPLTAITGEQDLWVTPDEIEAWAVHTSGPFKLLKFPGDHFYFKRDGSSLVEHIISALHATAS